MGQSEDLCQGLGSRKKDGNMGPAGGKCAIAQFFNPLEISQKV
jgi:hypothetical protein